MACTCSDESCTQVVVDGITYCDCLISQDVVCPDGSEIINLGEGNMVCRTIYNIEPTPCGTISCDTANGYAYNPITNKCEKTTQTEPCAPGYTFVPTNDGIGKCVPSASAGILLCPTGYTYDSINKRCTKVVSNPATSSSITSCNADIVIVYGINAHTLAREATFINRFIDNITTNLNSTTYNYRVGTTSCTPSTSSSTNYLFSGPGNIVTSTTGTADFIKSQFPTIASTQTNCIVKGLTVAASMLYNSKTVTSGPLLLPRTGVRKIIILITENGPTAAGSYTVIPFGSCMGTDATDVPGHYPTGFTMYKEMRYAVNQAHCLINNNPSLEIFVVNTGTPGDPGVFGSLEAQFYQDVKSTGVVYNVNDGNASSQADNLTAAFLALGVKTGAPAVCGVTTTYSCPTGQTLIGTTCQGLDVQPSAECDPTCTITPSGSNALCTCSLPSVPTLCGSCPVVNNKCNCTIQQNPTIIPSVTPISLDDPTYFDKIEWTISYDPKEKMWISFHDWHPSLLIPAHNHFYTIKNGSFWKHNERFDSFTNYYNESTVDHSKDYGWEVEHNVITPNQITTLRSIEYYMEAYKYFNDGKDVFHVLDENFDRAIIYNSEQVSPLLKLKIKDKNNPLQQLSYPIITSVNTEILASKEENKYRFNNFYDITKERFEFLTTAVTVPGFMTPALGTFNSMFITAIDGYHKTINPAYVDVLKAPLEHKKFRHFGNKIILRKTKSGDKKMLLKLVNSKMLNSPK